MARSPGEVSRIEAAAQQARAWFRDLAMMVFGPLHDRNPSTGKPSVMSAHLRRSRLGRHEDFVEHRTNFIERDVFGRPWHSVDSISFAGVLWKEGDYEVLVDHLNALRLQVAMIVDFHDYDLFDKLAAAEAPAQGLGAMKAPFKDHALPDASNLLEQE